MGDNIERFELNEIRKVLQKRYQESAAQQPSSPEESARQNQEALEQPIVGYRVLEKMGSGGTAVVFRAQHIATEEIVALKLLYPGFNQDKKMLKQFINEGMMLMRLNHPNILKGIDFGVSKGMYFLALEFVRGESLDSFLNKKLTFTERSTLEMALQISRAMAYLESKNIIHRDIKPANILLKDNLVKLCDFAYALEINSKKKDEEDLEEITCGTVAYISPEQARGYKDLDSRSDVYSLGITCYHMLTGDVPFVSENSQEIMRQQIYEKIDLNKIPGLSPSGKMILQLMLAKKREERITPTRLLALLEKYFKIPTTKQPKK